MTKTHALDFRQIIIKGTKGGGQLNLKKQGLCVLYSFQNFHYPFVSLTVHEYYCSIARVKQALAKIIRQKYWVFLCGGHLIGSRRPALFMQEKRN